MSNDLLGVWQTVVDEVSRATGKIGSDLPICVILFGGELRDAMRSNAAMRAALESLASWHEPIPQEEWALARRLIAAALADPPEGEAGTVGECAAKGDDQ